MKALYTTAAKMKAFFATEAKMKAFFTRETKMKAFFTRAAKMKAFFTTDAKNGPAEALGKGRPNREIEIAKFGQMRAGARRGSL